MTRSRRALVAEVALVAIAAIWGLTFVMVQDAVAIIPTTTFLAYRFLLATALVAIVFRRPLARLPKAGWGAGLTMGAFLTAGYLFQTLGLERTSAANAGFITGLFVVLTPLFGSLVTLHSPGWMSWAAALTSAVGLYLLTGGASTGINGGDGLVFLCACSFAAHILVTDRAIRRFDAGALLVVQLGVAGIVPLVIAVVNGELLIPAGRSVWAAILVTAVLASALGFFVQTYAQSHAPPARTALILASEPAFAGLFAFLLDGERLDLLGWLGAALIMAAILVVEVVPRRPVPPAPEAHVPPPIEGAEDAETPRNLSAPGTV